MHIELSTAIISLTLLLIIIVMSWLCHVIDFVKAPIYLTSQEEKIPYPEEPMFDNYESIKSELKQIWHECQLPNLYTRIVLFDIFYKDSPTFYNELVELYNEKEQSVLKSNSV